MSVQVIVATVAQTEPTKDQAFLLNGSNLLGIKATATGTGTWSAIFNVRPVCTDARGTVGDKLQISVSNASADGRVTNAPFFTPDVSFIGWWSDVVGTVTSMIGEVEK